jgi:transglutaminase-like putative cysteine protease
LIYGVRHRTTYQYDSEVAFARCMLRLTPVTNTAQTLLESSITVTPPPALKTIKRDAFGAQVVSMVIDTPHTALIIESRCVVGVHAQPSHVGAGSPPWEVVREAALTTRRLDADSPALHLYPTRATPHVPAIADYALQSFTPGRAILEAAAELMGRLKDEFAYDPEATDVRTPVAEAFAQRRGVCQDFAHVMICGLRGAGLPARYVSGYIRTIPAPGQPRLEGVDATHAWVELWCGDAQGWIGLDPTNNLFTGTEHLILACGRDYSDVAPIDGVLLGVGNQLLDVEVDVAELPRKDEAGASGAAGRERAHGVRSGPGAR